MPCEKCRKRREAIKRRLKSLLSNGPARPPVPDGTEVTESQPIAIDSVVEKTDRTEVAAPIRP